jgi:hypothetical protein
MAEIIRPNGQRQLVRPAGATFTLEELYRYVETNVVEAVRLADGRTLWCDEEAKCREPWPPANAEATRLVAEAGGIPGDIVLGTVLVTSPEEEEEG